MTARHKYEPSPEELQQLRGPSDVDCDDSTYVYIKALELHHASTIAGWDKPEGLHKAERVTPTPLSKKFAWLVGTHLTTFICLQSSIISLL